MAGLITIQLTPARLLPLGPRPLPHLGDHASSGWHAPSPTGEEGNRREQARAAHAPHPPTPRNKGGRHPPGGGRELRAFGRLAPVQAVSGHREGQCSRWLPCGAREAWWVGARGLRPDRARAPEAP